jgi:hypothetical protein
VNRSDIERIIKETTGNPDTGAVHEWTPKIVDALDAAMNPKTRTKTKNETETRLMTPDGDTR